MQVQAARFLRASASPWSACANSLAAAPRRNMHTTIEGFAQLLSLSPVSRLSYRTTRCRPSFKAAAATGWGPSAADQQQPQQHLIQFLTSVRSLSELKSLLDAYPAEFVDGELGAMALLTAAEMEPGAGVARTQALDEEEGEEEDSALADAVAAEVELVREAGWKVPCAAPAHDPACACHCHQL